MIREALDKNPEVWSIMNVLWKDKLGIELEYGKTHYCCDVLNSYNTTFSLVYLKDELANKISMFEKQLGSLDSIGNVMPLPAILNSPHTGRANWNSMGDFFDNYLEFVRSYYCPSSVSEYKLSICDRASCKTIYRQRAYEICYTYFEKFECFESYVELNFLQPFFENDKDDRKYSTVKKLDFREDYKEKKLSGEDFISNFMKISISIIKEREELMLEEYNNIFKKYQFCM